MITGLFSYIIKKAVQKLYFLKLYCLGKEFKSIINEIHNYTILTKFKIIYFDIIHNHIYQLHSKFIIF